MPSAVIWIHPVQCLHDARKLINCSKAVDQRQQNSSPKRWEFLELCECLPWLN